jgi:hypothetical protein
MGEYSAAVALAARLIKKKGRSGVAVYRPTASAPSNAARPWKLDNPSAPPADALVASGLHVVFTDPRQVRGQLGQFGLEVSFRADLEMPDSLVPNASAVAYFIPAELGASVLQVGDLVVTDGHRYVVLRCDPLKPGDELVLYTVQLKE